MKNNKAVLITIPKNTKQQIMKKNVSIMDRALRLLIAAALVFLNISGIVNKPESILLWVVAAIFALTALAGSCAVYTLFGINTHSRKKEIRKYN